MYSYFLNSKSEQPIKFGNLNVCVVLVQHVCVVNDLGKKKFAVEANNLND